MMKKILFLFFVCVCPFALWLSLHGDAQATTAATPTENALCKRIEKKLSTLPQQTLSKLEQLLQKYITTKKLSANNKIIYTALKNCISEVKEKKVPKEEPEIDDSEETQTTSTAVSTLLCQQEITDFTANFRKRKFVVGSEQEIRDVLEKAKKRADTNLWYEISIKKGTYTLNNGFWVDTPNIIFAGETGNPADVVLKGKGMQGGITHIFWVVADNIWIGDITLGEVANHVIQVHGEKNVSNFLLHNAVIYNAKEQLLKGSFDTNKPGNYSQDGVIQCSSFSYPVGYGLQYYMGGIDIHHGKNWLVQYNEFKGIRSPEKNIAEHAIHFRSASENTKVYYNTISNCDRGIGFGLGSAGHIGGEIIGNTITHDATRGDVGIGLENASNVLVSGNTIFFENDYANAIEYRFPGTSVRLVHNETNKKIVARDGGVLLSLEEEPESSEEIQTTSADSSTSSESISCTIFPSNNPWNTDISSYPVHPNSAQYIKTITARKNRLHPDFGANRDGGPFGIPYVLVNGATPRVPVKALRYPEESDQGNFPVPLNAPIEKGSDQHVIAVDMSGCKLYELYAAEKKGAGREAGSVAVFAMTSNALRPDGWTSADAAGLPIFAGLVRYDEVAQGEIRHALRFTLSKTQKAYIAPATHYASDITDTNQAPMGLRFRLKKDYDISKITGQSKVIAQALKTYGMIVADNGSDRFISGAPDARRDDEDLNQIKTIPGDAFEVVDTGPIVK